MKVRVFQNPDGSVRILRPNMTRIGDTSADLDREMAKDDTLSGLSFQDVDSMQIPIDRAMRYKWRLRQRGGRQVVEVDPTVPDRPIVER